MSLLAGPFVFIVRGFGVPLVFKFPLAPQELRVFDLARGQIHQTVSDNFLDDFSGARAVLTRVQMRGTFGYSARTGGLYGATKMSGAAHLRAFEAIFETFNALSRQLKNTAGMVHEYVNPGRLYFWRIWMERFEYQQNSRDPMLVHYNIAFSRLQDYLSPGGPSLPPNLFPGSTQLLARFGSLSSAAESLVGRLF